jgi:hypothetical protein
VLPAANALTPRLDFNDNHYTYLNAGEIRVCGDHICHPDEWNYWMTQLMKNQRKNAGSLPEDMIPNGYNLNPIAYGKSGSTDPSSGEITKITTFEWVEMSFHPLFLSHIMAILTSIIS